MRDTTNIDQGREHKQSAPSKVGKKATRKLARIIDKEEAVCWKRLYDSLSLKQQAVWDKFSEKKKTEISIILNNMEALVYPALNEMGAQDREKDLFVNKTDRLKTVLSLFDGIQEEVWNGTVKFSNKDSKKFFKFLKTCDFSEFSSMTDIGLSDIMHESFSADRESVAEHAMNRVDEVMFRNSDELIATGDYDRRLSSSFRMAFRTSVGTAVFFAGGLGLLIGGGVLLASVAPLALLAASLSLGVFGAVSVAFGFKSVKIFQQRKAQRQALYVEGVTPSVLNVKSKQKSVLRVIEGPAALEHRTNCAKKMQDGLRALEESESAEERSSSPEHEFNSEGKERLKQQMRLAASELNVAKKFSFAETLEEESGLSFEQESNATDYQTISEVSAAQESGEQATECKVVAEDEKSNDYNNSPCTRSNSIETEDSIDENGYNHTNFKRNPFFGSSTSSSGLNASSQSGSYYSEGQHSYFTLDSLDPSIDENGYETFDCDGIELEDITFDPEGDYSKIDVNKLDTDQFELKSSSSHRFAYRPSGLYAAIEDEVESSADESTSLVSEATTSNAGRSR